MLFLSAGELSGPIVTGWLLPYVGVRQWCGLLAGIGVVVLLLYIVTFFCLRPRKTVLSPLISSHNMP